MEHKEAVYLLRHTDFDIHQKSTWLDLGCGEGIFTLALASLLDRDSVIHAIDISQKSLNKIPDRFDNVQIQKWKLDFVANAFPVSPVHGILMANSFHYVQHKEDFLEKAVSSLQAGGYFLIVEYDSDHSNPWIPYPVSFSSLQFIFENAGLGPVRKLHTHSSVYNQAGMYSALVQKKQE